jgi:hypothetical protein
MDGVPLMDFVEKRLSTLSFMRTPKLQLFMEFLETKISENKDHNAFSISIPPIGNELGFQAFSPDVQEFLILLARRKAILNFHTPIKAMMNGEVISSINYGRPPFANELDIRREYDSGEVEARSVSFTINDPKEVKAVCDSIMSLKTSLITESALNRTNLRLNVVSRDGTSGDKFRVVFEGRTLSYRTQIHRFHKGDENKGRPLRFLTLLWENRYENIKNQVKKKGEVKSEAYYAQKLDLQTDLSLYNKGNESEKILTNLIKGYNRVFQDKKFPMKIIRADGILLKIKI